MFYDQKNYPQKKKSKQVVKFWVMRLLLLEVVLSWLIFDVMCCLVLILSVMELSDTT
jgi:hypothetical protein